MKGTVIDINMNKGFIAIQTDNGITVAELIGGYQVELDDEISGNLDALGGEELFNITHDEKMDVFIQAIYCSDKNARELMK